MSAHTPEQMREMRANGSAYEDKVALECVVGEFRYHFWIVSKTLQPEDVLYRNPANWDHHVRTVKLRRGAKAHQPMVDALLRAAPQLIADWRARMAAEEEARRVRREAAAADERLHAAAPALAAALREVRPLIDDLIVLAVKYDLSQGRLTTCRDAISAALNEAGL